MILKLKRLRIQPMYRWYDLYVGLYISIKDWQFYFVFFGLVLKIWQEIEGVVVDTKDWPVVIGESEIEMLYASIDGIDEHGDFIMSIGYQEKWKRDK